MTLQDVQRQLETKLAEIKEQAKDRVDRFDTRLDMLEAQMNRPNQAPPLSSPSRSFKRAGDKVLEAKDHFELLARTHRVSFDVGCFHQHNPEGKALIDSAALGFGTPGMLQSQRIEGIIPPAQRRLTVADLMPRRPITTAQIDFIRTSSYINRASPQTEGASKAESEMQFAVASEKVRTIAHHLSLTRQALDDLPELQRFINTELVYGLKLVEEYELLSGSNTGNHMHGLTTTATSYAGTYNATGDTKLDKLRHAILELENVDETCTGFVIHPRDWHDIELIKDEAGGANKGRYVVGDPLGGVLQVHSVWGRPTVVTRSIPAGSFLGGNFANAVIGDRMDAVVDISYEHASNFIENKVTLLAEERLALAILRTGSFVYGSF